MPNCNYIREIHLGSLLKIKWEKLTDKSRNGNKNIIRLLNSKLQLQKNKFETRHWSYDKNYHLALIAAYKAEIRQFIKQN